jgi:hypothetical protein
MAINQLRPLRSDRSRMRADTLVTHEAPESHPQGWRALGELAEVMKVGKLIHEHHHTNYRGMTAAGVTVIGVANENWEVQCSRFIGKPILRYLGHSDADPNAGTGGGPAVL